MIWIAPSENDTNNATLVSSLSASDGERAGVRGDGYPRPSDGRGAEDEGYSGDPAKDLAGSGLEGEIKHGGNINSYYDDPHDATGLFDFVLAKSSHNQPPTP